MRTENETILEELSGTDMSVDITSPAYSIEHIYGFSVQFKWSGSATGNLTIQGSNDVWDNTQNYNVVNWETIPGAEFDVSTGTSVLFNIDRAFYRWFRVNFVSAGGAASMELAQFMIKGV